MKAEAGLNDTLSPANPPGATDQPSRPLPQQPGPTTLAELFVGFLQIGLYGFGGLAAISRHIIVEKYKWLTEQDYAALFGICQVLPGGNVINVATILGDRYRGLTGAIVAVCGLFAMPLVLLVILAAGYEQISDHPDAKAGAVGAAAAAAGLVVGTAIKMMRSLKLGLIPLGFSLVAFLCLALARLPLIPTLVVLLPLSVATTMWVRRK